MIELQISSDELRNTSGKIVEWFKTEHDSVIKDEPLLIVETNKVSLEVVCPASGYLEKIKKSVGDEVTASDVLALINPEMNETASREAKVDSQFSESFAINMDAERQSPVVRRLLREFSLDIKDVPATGRDGRLTKADIQEYLSKNQLDQASDKSQLYAFSDRQKFAAKAIMQSFTEIPQVTAVFEADLSAIMKDREERHSPKSRLSITAYLVECLRDTLLLYPQFNGHYSDQGIISYAAINIGIITSLPNHELIIPTLKQTNKKSLLDIAAGIEHLKLASIKGQLNLSDIEDATFSISNYGVSGTILATPIIIPRPQIAVLGVGKMEWRQKLIKTQQGFVNKIYPAIYITLTIDHRAINGSLASVFMNQLISLVEQYGLADIKKEAC